ncbi:MAG: DUF3455 domain-containing protein [Burkholderiaceae bacterium]|jgi:hypothetical protein
MKRFDRSPIRARVQPSRLLASACVLVACLSSGCFHFERDPTIPKIYSPNPSGRLAPVAPKELEPPAGNSVGFVFAASGSQNYECRSSGAGYAWVFTGPQARLYNADDVQVGKHYAGPTWEYQDGSKVKGSVLKHVASPNPKSVDELLLKVEPHSGTGMFSDVSFIQRLRTFGGAPPEEDCATERVGITKSVEYSAQYVFFIAS